MAAGAGTETGSSRNGLMAAGDGMRSVRDGGAFCPIFISLGDGDV